PALRPSASSTKVAGGPIREAAALPTAPSPGAAKRSAATRLRRGQRAPYAAAREPGGAEGAQRRRAAGAPTVLGPPDGVAVEQERHAGPGGIGRREPAKPIAFVEQRHGTVVRGLEPDGLVAQHHPVTPCTRADRRVPFRLG